LPVFIKADLLALNHFTIVWNANFPRDLFAGSLGVDLLHQLLFQGTLLNRPFLTLLVELNWKKNEFDINKSTLNDIVWLSAITW
jgi:hypothetical protein